jgi:hypothetical protein
MPSSYTRYRPVYPKLIYTTKATGAQSSYDFSPYSPGDVQYARPDTQRRKRPANVTEYSSLTSFGGHFEQRVYYPPISFTADYGSYLATYQDWESSQFATVGSVGPPATPDWQTALRLQIKDQKVNLANALAEMRQTQGMFVQNAAAIADAFRNLKRGNVPGAFRALGLPPRQLRGTIANRWLEMRYGWIPLLSDLHGSVEELQTAFNRPWFRKIRVRKVAERRIRSDGMPLYNGTKTYSDNQYKTVVKVVAYVRGNPPTSTRLGFTNPLTVAWELTPYSFVVDWFIPIGNWLNAMDADVGTTSCYGTVTTKDTVIGTSSLGAYAYMRTYGRSVFSGVPELPLPRYEPSLGVTRVANALALLSQVFKDDNPSSTRRPDGSGNKRSSPGYSNWKAPTRRRLGP